MTHRLGVIGAGHMAEAIVRGLIDGGALKPADIIASDVSPERRKLFASLKVDVTGDNKAAANSDIVLLSVKPQQMRDVLRDIAPTVRPKSLLISIAAAIPTEFIEKTLGRGVPWRVVRAMPNTPLLAGSGVVALAGGRHATSGDVKKARGLFLKRATVLTLPEAMIDAVTALSGSGPAYFFYLVEHMIRAGTRLGLDPKTAKDLARHTAKGAAAMLMATTESPADLRRKVTSPGGTTEAAIDVLEESGVGDTLVKAMKAAAGRARTLRKKYTR